jgi:protein gp37
MGESSNIAWCDHTFNPWVGCREISAGCKHCYARGLAARYGWDVWGLPKRRRVTADSTWKGPRKWDRAAKLARHSPRVFCGSLCDVFEDNAELEGPRARLWNLIWETPHLDWLLLTKRADRIQACLPPDWLEMGCEGYPNVWLGVSIEDASVADRAVQLAAVPATVRFVSYEPALGPLADEVNLLGIDWVIYGGESGPHHRPNDRQWARDMLDVCRRRQVAFFYKQSGGVRPGEGVELDGELIQEFPRVSLLD